MLRHRSLVPLSHDHHLGLVAAQRLKRGDAAYRSSRSVASSVAELWRGKLEQHFALEEQCLFPIAQSDATRALVARALDEHSAMRTLVERIDRGESIDEAARELGRILEQHIRFEERELFERLQEEAGEEQLADAGKRIEEGHSPRSCRDDANG